MKKYVSMFLSVLMVLSLGTTAFAADISSATVPPEPEDYGAPIEERTYYDEELEGYVTERTYFVPDNDGIEMYSSASGSGWFKNEKSYRGWSPNPGNKATTYYAKGYFTWGNGRCDVSNWSGGYDWMPVNWSVVASGTNVTHGYGSYKDNINYAYVTYNLKVHADYSGYKTFNVTCRISDRGDKV